jgi:hypothetical protein
MERATKPRCAGERGISPRALAATATDEAPGPGAERKVWVAGGLAGGARSPTGAGLPRGRARFETVRCPLCGKVARARYDYCEVEEVGTVQEVYEKLLKPDSALTRALRLSGISVEEVPQWLKALISKGKGNYKVFLVDCHD